MKVLVVDRDQITTQLIKAKLQDMGCSVVEEMDKNTALEKVEQDKFDLVFYDPTPLKDPRPFAFGIRRVVDHYPYIVIMSQEIEREAAYRSSANELLTKPLDSSRLAEMIDNSKRLTKMIDLLGDENEDFPNAGGIISKSAVNQLFLAALERADRYAEVSHMLFISIPNYDDIAAFDGAQIASLTTAKLSKYLSRLRRQSDIIAQTGKGQFCVMLQRPQFEDEPLEATKRFVEALNGLSEITESDTSEIHIHTSLVSVPVGELMASYDLHFDKLGVKTERR